MGSRRRLAFAVFGAAVTVFFVGLFARGVAREWGSFRSAFARCNWLYVPPAVALFLSVFVVKAFRWAVILRPFATPGYWPLFSATAIGFMGNCILPARLGEVLRAAVLGARTGLSKSTLFATIVVERLFDLFGVVSVSSVGLAWLAWGRGQSTESSRRLLVGAMMLGGGIAAGVAFLVMLRVRGDRVRRAVQAAFSWLPRRAQGAATALLDSFIEGLSTVRSARQALIASAWSVLHWLMMGGVVWLTALCFLGQAFSAEDGGAQRTFYLPPGGALLVQAFLSLAVVLPQAPGFLGVHQTASTEATKLVLGSGAAGIARAYAVLLWCVFTLPVVALGAACLWREGLSLAQVRRMDGAAQPAADASASNTASAEG